MNKHNKPYKCLFCSDQFVEKRRCDQHMLTIHNLATESDYTHCGWGTCPYKSLRPDAVKRHKKLKQHGEKGVIL